MKTKETNTSADKRAVDWKAPLAGLGAVAAILGISIEPDTLAAYLLTVFGLFWLGAILWLTGEGRYRMALDIFGQTHWTGWYRSLVGVPFTKLWRRISAPLPKQVSFKETFRSAMHPSVMDVALRVAVAYPVLLLILPWIVSYSDARLGDITLLQATPFWPDRAVNAALIASLIFLLFVRPLLYRRKGDFQRFLGYRSNNWVSNIVVIAGSVAVLLTVISVLWVVFSDEEKLSAGALKGVGAVTLVIFVVFAVKFSGIGAAAFAGVVVPGLTLIIVIVAFAFSAVIGEPPRNGVNALFAIIIMLVSAVASAVAVAAAVATVVSFLWDTSRYRLALTSVFLGVPILSISVSLGIPEAEEDSLKLMFVFLGIFPLVNAGFDFLSYTLTLALMRFGFRRPWPWLYAIFDLLCAAILFFLLGVTLVVVITILNNLAGPQAELFSLGTLLTDLESEPEKHLWAFLMVFSTLIPTLAHLFLAAVSFISIASFLRPPTLRLLEKAPEDKLAALGAPFMISLIVFATAAAAYVLIWLVRLFAGDVIEGYLQGYIGLLRWIAQSIGAF